MLGNLDAAPNLLHRKLTSLPLAGTVLVSYFTAFLESSRAPGTHLNHVHDTDPRGVRLDARQAIVASRGLWVRNSADGELPG